MERMKKKTENIKPCPFCGSKASWFGTIDTEWIMCSKCFACSDVFEVDKGYAERSWNKRFDFKK